MASPNRTLSALSDAVKGDINRIADVPTNGTLFVNTTPARLTLKSAAGATENRTLPRPRYAGMELAIDFGGQGAGSTVTITFPSPTINAAGNNTLVFEEAADFVLLRSIDMGSVLAWRVIATDGVTPTTV